MFNFGAGRAYINSGGQAYEIGVVQSASLELKVDMKELRSSAHRYPRAIADGKGSCSGKINFMHLWPETLSQIIANGGAITNGLGTNNESAVIAETGTVAAVVNPTGYTPGTYYLYTLAGPNATTNFVTNSEVVQVISGGVPYYYTRAALGSEKTASAQGNASGAYSVQAGITYGSAYTTILSFAAADVGTKVIVTYLLGEGTGVGPGKNAYGINVGSMSMNSATTFSMVLIGQGKNIYTNAPQQFIVNLNACLAPSLKFNFKLDDFTDMELDFMAYLDGNGNLGSVYLVNP